MRWQSKKREIRRIVSLTPSNTEILFALGLGDRVVGVTEYCNYPPEARKKPKVGDVNISPERVIALKPDLVVAHSFLNQRVIPTLQRLGVRVVAENPNTLQKLMAFILRLGQITGKASAAKQLVGRMKKTIQSVQQQAAKMSHHPRVLFLLNVDPPWAAGEQTLVSELIRMAGGQNVIQIKRTGFHAVSMETVLAADPEVIILVGRDKKPLLENPLWQRTTAVRNQQVFMVDNDIFLREGPRLIDALQILAKLIQRW